MLKCLHCGYEWKERVDKPKSCPNCTRHYYDRPVKRTINRKPKQQPQPVVPIKPKTIITPPEL